MRVYIWWFFLTRTTKGISKDSFVERMENDKKSKARFISAWIRLINIYY